MSYSLKPLNERHRKPVIDIFNYYVENSFAAYPDSPVGNEFFDRLIDLSKGYPAVAVTTNDEKVIGFGMLRRYHYANTFNKTVEITYFISPEHTRKGIGTLMLNYFFEESRKRGIDTILASISSLNEESLNFHLKHGFVECGRFKKIGHKLGKDFDVVWMQKKL